VRKEDGTMETKPEKIEKKMRIRVCIYIYIYIYVCDREKEKKSVRMEVCISKRQKGIREKGESFKYINILTDLREGEVGC